MAYTGAALEHDWWHRYPYGEVGALERCDWFDGQGLDRTADQ